MIMSEQGPERKPFTGKQEKRTVEEPADDALDAEIEEDPYADSVALFALLTEEHLMHNTEPLIRMWNSILDFFEDAEVAFDAVKIDTYPGEQVIPSLEARLAQDVQEDFLMMGFDGATAAAGMIPPFIIIMNGQEEIVFFSRVQNAELFRLSPKELPDREVWVSDKSLKKAVAELFTTKFDEHNFYTRYYRTLTADDLPRGIKRFLIKTVREKDFS